MTTTQMNAMRNLWETTTKAEVTMTAREMALTAHDLHRNGYQATTEDGAVWTWDARREVWGR